MLPKIVLGPLAVAGMACLAAATVLADGETRVERLQFERGATGAVVKNSITGYESIDYKLGAKARQTMRVSLKTDNGATYFNVLPPGSVTAIGRGDTSGNAWTGTLPADGEYTVSVYLMRSAARRNETANYTLTVDITGDADAKVAGTPYHATGTAPCSVGPDPKGSAQCSFGVVRGAPGEARVHLAAVGHDVTLHTDKEETVLVFNGDTVTSADPKDKVTAEKRGDEWSVGINDFHFYVIPEAVISGG